MLVTDVNMLVCPTWWCSGCWESSSCVGESWVPLSQLLSWIHTSFSVSVLWKVRTASRRRQISSSWSSHDHGRSGKSLNLFCKHCISSFIVYWRTVLNNRLDIGSPCLDLFGYRNFCSLRLSVPKPSGLCISSSRSWCCSGRRCKIWGPPKLIGERWNRMLSWSRPSLSTFWFPTHGISVLSYCMLQCGLLSGRIFWIQPDLQLIYCQALGTFLITDLSEQFAQREQWANRAVVAHIFHVSFLVNHFFRHFLQVLKCEIVSLYDLVEELSHHVSRLVVASYDVFGTNSNAVWRFAFFEFADCAL